MTVLQRDKNEIEYSICIFKQRQPSKFVERMRVIMISQMMKIGTYPKKNLGKVPYRKCMCSKRTVRERKK